MVNKFVVFILFHFLDPVICCPSNISSNCICQPGPSLICSCSSANQQKFRLSAEQIPARLAQLIIHNCAIVIVPAGTFRAKSVLDQIKFIDIGTLHFESGAFRGIRRSPRLLLIQNISRITIILPLTFAGLGRIQHFWWHNVSIGQVQGRAFAKLWPLGYLYFRQVHIQKVASAGFGQMPSVEHFFLRGRIRLDWLSEGAFGNSKVEDMVVEDALIKGSPGALAGLRAQRLRMLNCRWGNGRRAKSGLRKHTIKKINPETRIEDITLRNCTFANMLWIAHSQKALLENCTVGRWLEHFGNDGQKPLQVHDTRIRHWENMGLGWAEITVERSRIGIIKANQHVPLREDLSNLRISIQNSRIRLFSSHAFVGRKLASFQLLNSSVARWHGSPLAQSSHSEILIADSQINVLPLEEESNEGAFARINASALQLLRSTVLGSFGRDPFSELDILEVKNCHFEQSIGNGLFDRLEANQGIEFSANDWPCGKEEECGTEQLLLAAPAIPHWRFSANRCVPFANVTDYSTNQQPSCQSSNAINSPILCRHLGFLQECLCITSTPPGQSLQLRPLLDARVLLLSDCPELDVHLRLVPSTLSHLYIFRVGQIQLSSVPSSLRHLHVLHSTIHVQMDSAFEEAKLQEFSVSAGHLNGQPPSNFFQWQRLGRILLYDTVISAQWASTLNRAGIVFDETIRIREEQQIGREQPLRKRCVQQANCLERNGQERPDIRPMMIFLLFVLIFIEFM